MNRDTVWVWGADIHCDDCYQSGDLDGPDCDGNEAEGYDADSNESDSPQHCGTCGTFLGCPLTDVGQAYVRHAVATALREGKAEEDSVALSEWAPFYDVPTKLPTAADVLDDLTFWVDLPHGYRVAAPTARLPGRVTDLCPGYQPGCEEPGKVLYEAATEVELVTWCVAQGWIEATEEGKTP